MASLLAFLKALPKLVSLFETLLEKLDENQEAKIDKRINEIKIKVASDLKQIEKAVTNEQRSKLIRSLNNTLKL